MSLGRCLDTRGAREITDNDNSNERGITRARVRKIDKVITHT